MINKKQILITGGLGFIGFHLAKRLLENRENVVAIVDNFSTGIKDKDVEELLAKYPDTLSIIPGDVSRSEFPAIEFDEVYHMAAVRATKYKFHGSETLEKNVDSVRGLLRHFKNKNTKILFASTGETFGALDPDYIGTPTKETCPVGITDIYDKRWTYALSKIVGESLFIHTPKNCKYVIARMQNPYGPRMGYDNVMPIFMKKHLSGEKVICNTPFDTRPFTYIDDVVDGLILLMESDNTDGQIFNLATDKEITLKELLETMSSTIGIDYQIERVDGIIKEQRFIDSSKIKLLGWNQKVSLSEGIIKTFDWYKNNETKTN